MTLRDSARDRDQALRRAQALPRLLGLGVALLGSACEPTGADRAGHGDVSTDGGVDRAFADASTLACRGAVTESCTCNNGRSGIETCEHNTFGPCVCGAPTSDSGSWIVEPLYCKAGYYVGSFDGMYLPSAVGGALVSSAQVAGKAVGSTPALALAIEEQLMGDPNDFTSFTIGNGCMTGIAQAFGLPDMRFVARITGNLDCAIGAFEARLDGQYAPFNTSSVPTPFSGRLSAQFYLPQALKDGQWQVPAGAPAPATGAFAGAQGSWSADWAANDWPDAGGDPCAALPASDGGAEDAGTTAGDAGTP